MAELKNLESELDRFRLRLLAAGLLVLAGFGLLAARLSYLQVHRHEDLAAQAETNRTAVLPIVPNRGQIVDRNGVVLATNYSAYTLEITPSKVADVEATIDQLSELLDIGNRDRRRFKRLVDENKRFESLPIRTKLSDEEVARFVAQRYRFPGVDVKARLFRSYPLGETGSHLLGYIGRINQAEKAQMEDWEDERLANYKGTEYIGKLGLEQSYEAQLHGQTGFERVETSAGGRAVRSLSQPRADAGRYAGAVDRHSAAGAGRGHVRRPPWRAGGDRPAQRRGAGLRQQADLRPEPVRRWHRRRKLARAERIDRQAAAQPRLARHLPARFDLQAVHGHGRVEQRQTRRQHGDHGQRQLHLRQPCLPQPWRQGPGAGGHGAIDRQVEQRLLLLAGRRDGRRPDPRPTRADGLRPQDRDRSARRIIGPAAIDRMEAALLQARATAEVVRGRDHLAGHRPGLQQLHHAAAGRRHRHAGLGRAALQAAAGQRDRRRRYRPPHARGQRGARSRCPSSPNTPN